MKHHDINIDNICIDDNGVVKLLSPSFYKLDRENYFINDEESGVKLSYAAPELDEKELTIDDSKVDVFGMGTIAFYMLTGVPNFTIF